MPSQCPIQSFLLGRWAIWWEYLVGTLMKSLISSHSLIPLQCLCQCYLLLVDIILARWYACCWICTLPTAQCTLQSAKCTLHCEMPDARILNFCNKGRHSMNWTDRRESVNNAKSASSYFFWLQYFVCKHFHICFGEAVPCWLQRLVLFQIIPVLTLLPFFRFVLLWHKVFGTFSN